MIRTLTLLLFTGLLLCGCKPTERTALKKKQAELATAPAAAGAELLPEPPAPAPLPEPEPLEPSASLLVVNATIQEYNPHQPWEKEEPRQMQALGVCIGEGRVLTTARVVRESTYVEMTLPDASRTVPARVERFDEDMNLALLTVAHEEDLSFFDTRTPLALGKALQRGEAATYAGLIDGVEPVQVELRAENVDGDKVPLMVMRAARPLPEGQTTGAPVVREGTLCALGVSYRKQEHLLQVVNAELIERFLTQEEAGVPVMGVQLTPLDDPLFRRYLKLDTAANGLYVSKVLPASAAEEAGIRVGDVITAVEDLPVDNQGRCNHPRYGLHSAAVLLRGMKERGQELQLTISRGGEEQQVAVKLNRSAVDNALFRPQKSGVQPRYIMWGGLLFQPLTSTLIDSLTDRHKGVLPLELQTLVQNQEELRQSGCTEPVGLTFVLPTAATQGYTDLRMSRLVAVNGKPVSCFADLPALLDETTENGLVRLEFNKPPYTIYIDRAEADAVNTHLQQAIPKLRVVQE